MRELIGLFEKCAPFTEGRSMMYRVLINDEKIYKGSGSMYSDIANYAPGHHSHAHFEVK
jgi:hypothetical protein